MAERARGSASLVPLTSLDLEPSVDVRVAQLNDVYNAAWIVCAAFDVLNTKHGYTEITLEPIRGGKDKHIEHIARKFAKDVKHKNKIMYVVIAPVASSGRSPRVGDGPPQSKLNSIKKTSSNTPVIEVLLPRTKRGLSSSSGFISPSPSSRNRTLSRESAGLSPFIGSRGLPIMNRQHSSSFGHGGGRRRPSFTPPLKIEGKQGHHKNKVVGVVVLDKRDSVFGLGPIAIHPHFSGRGFGRQLLQTVLEDWQDCKSDTYGQSIRLTVEAYSANSLSLFAKMGWYIRESLISLKGNIDIQTLPTHYSVSPLTQEAISQSELLEQCAKIMDTVFGYSRLNELKEAIDDSELYPFVVFKKKGTKRHVVGYTSSLAINGHSCALHMEDLQALIIGINSYYNLNHTEKKSEEPSKDIPKTNQKKRVSSNSSKMALPTEISFNIPGKYQPTLLKWCLDNGLKVAKQYSLLSIGQYELPKLKHYFPSILY